VADGVRGLTPLVSTRTVSLCRADLEQHSLGNQQQPASAIRVTVSASRSQQLRNTSATRTLQPTATAMPSCADISEGFAAIARYQLHAASQGPTPVDDLV
jgi:hypothetical protein